MVFYRKYRPQSLEELVGQPLVKQALNSAMNLKKLAHAYLLCGPKGTGKTSTARIIAKMVNCSAEQNNPCNKCLTCISITDGSNLDVVEMDAASNRGIEDIRALRENIKLAPTSANKKVYIIDEVHMLSNEAFNALLKTLEEPPSHVLFILATTEVQKIPPTILSRVQRLDFKPATTQELVEALQRVVNKESIEIDEVATLALAKKANGSFRDALKLLDQLAALGKIDQKMVEESLGAGHLEGIIKILESVAKMDSKEALERLVSQVENKVSIKEFTLSVLEILRQVVFIKNDLGDRLVKPEVSEEEYTMLKDLAAKFTLDRVIQSVECFEKSLDQSRFVSIPTLPLEMAVMESCQEQKSSVSFQVSEQENSSQGKVGVGSVDLGEEVRSSKNDDTQKIAEKWIYILETVRQYNCSLEALLRSVRIADCTEGSVIMEVPYSFHQRILEAPKSRDLLESVLSDILGRAVRVSTVLGQRQLQKEELVNVELAADDEIVRLASEIFNSEPVN